MYNPPDRNNWTGRIDVADGDLGTRWHQKTSCINLDSDELPTLKNDYKGIVLIGFKSDEGVRRNKGRTGAKEGPDALRKACCNLANHFSEKTIIYDIGDIICANQDLELAQDELRKIVAKVQSKDYFPFVFGGGHEVAYPHYMGIVETIDRDKTIGIINIDAHFDLRSQNGLASSGTSFYQISKACDSKKKSFNYFCIGIQRASNTQVLFNRANDLGVEFLLCHEVNTIASNQQNTKLQQFIQHMDYIYLTICLDVFDIAYAPGVSAPTAIGLSPEDALNCIREIVHSGKLISSDIAELNPSLDHNGMTAKLAAKLAYEIISEIQA